MLPKWLIPRRNAKASCLKGGNGSLLPKWYLPPQILSADGSFRPTHIFSSNFALGSLQRWDRSVCIIQVSLQWDTPAWKTMSVILGKKSRALRRKI